MSWLCRATYVLAAGLVIGHIALTWCGGGRPSPTTHRQKKQLSSQELKLAFANFWPGWPIRDNPITAELEKVCHDEGARCRILVVASAMDADLIVSSVVAKQNISGLPGVKVCYTRENIGINGSAGYRNLDLTGYDYVIGFHDQYAAGSRKIPSIRWPAYLWAGCEGFLKQGVPLATAAERCASLLEQSMRPLDERNRSATLIARSDSDIVGPAPGPRFRGRILEAFTRAGVRVDCPSNIGKNMPSIEDLGMDKVEFVSHYTFNICPENSASLGYVTEKLFQAGMAGAIPVYFGNLLQEDTEIFNTDRIIFVDPDNINAAAEHVSNMLHNDTLLREMFNRPVLAPNASQTMELMYTRYYNGLVQIVLAALKRKESLALTTSTR